MPKPGQVWIVQDTQHDKPRSATHTGYARTPAGQLIRLDLWLTEGEDGQTYLQGRAQYRGDNWEQITKDRSLKEKRLAERRAKRKTRSPARLAKQLEQRC